MRTNSYFIAFILVFLAGLSWSFGAVVVRHMENANNFVFQYLFCRGISIAIIYYAKFVFYLLLRQSNAAPLKFTIIFVPVLHLFCSYHEMSRET